MCTSHPENKDTSSACGTNIENMNNVQDESGRIVTLEGKEGRNS